ncbi:A/G-specific adenine glycosylase [Zhouia spongiae]|uniref:Adenine DNA glycosylase n=1 Tax=Zhouia spongiae TaxID=2202721 RepID=A0ABY3YP48_9FLAO|nr:A/G-specific adenine glycosylase [Zhouia spongiae]UNY99544.1 A/G-specific adenine glycosylase [Zhouia spongiae]
MFSSKIRQWYKANKRALPWRESQDPYRIWLSEIMLQQTRVEQGLPYYKKFTENYPTVFQLAAASEEEVLKMWQGLGYYSRARNLHATAKHVAENLNGIFPDSYKELKKLKGVGDYTASAIASFCFDIPEPVVDGNVYRVLARYFGVDFAINSTEGIKYFKELASELIDKGNPAEYNQGIMEFGAIQCKPQSPKCGTCPLNDGCLALQKGRIEQLPVKLKKTKVKDRYFNYLVLRSEGETLIRQRRQKDIWQNLYEFPLIESKQELDIQQLEEHPYFTALLAGANYSLTLFNAQPKVHKLSHQHLYTKFWVVHLHAPIENGIPCQELDEYPMPVLIANFVEEYSF